MIVQRILRQCMKKIGVVNIGSDMGAVHYEDALESINSMLKSWATQGLIVHHVVTENFPLVAGQGSYTIGTSGDFNTSRPNRIVGGYIRDDSNVDEPLYIIGRDKYNRIPDKTIQAQPCALYYYLTYPLGVIYFDTVPDDTYTLFIDSLKPLTELVLDAELNLPPEYEEAIIYNGAIRLAPDYNRDVPTEVAAIALSSYNALSIQPVPEAQFNGIPGRRPEKYNIYSGY